jgi:HAD superfamily hydrolase (TIGR01484 family)
MKKLIVFDLDGTLAKSKSPIDASMASLLTKLLEVLQVAVISGGAWPQFRSQMLAHLPQDRRLERLSILPTSGTRFFCYDGEWRQLYAEDFADDEKAAISAALNKALDQSGFRVAEPQGPIIEDRGGQITMSALGQDAPLEAKRTWDHDFAKRKAIKAILTPLLPQYSVGMGGTTSIDITRPGIDKAYGIGKLTTVLGVPVKDMLFVGDALFPGGNDFPATRTGVACIKVRDPEETERVIEAVLACVTP